MVFYLPSDEMLQNDRQRLDSCRTTHVCFLVAGYPGIAVSLLHSIRRYRGNGRHGQQVVGQARTGFMPTCTLVMKNVRCMCGKERRGTWALGGHECARDGSVHRILYHIRAAQYDQVKTGGFPENELDGVCLSLFGPSVNDDRLGPYVMYRTLQYLYCIPARHDTRRTMRETRFTSSLRACSPFYVF